MPVSGRFILVVGYGEQAVRDHFGDGSGLGVEIEYVLQKRQRGTADALLSAEGLVSGSFLMMNGGYDRQFRRDRGTLGIACSRNGSCERLKTPASTVWLFLKATGL